jgi:hypothetical protein
MFEEFAGWVGWQPSDDKDAPPSPLVWANDPQFDVAILKSFFDEPYWVDHGGWMRTHNKWPFSFRAERSYRTLRDLAWPDGGLTGVEPQKIAHHALHDAIYQAKVVCEGYRRLSIGQPTLSTPQGLQK